MPRRVLTTLAVAGWLLATASTASAAPPSNDDFERAAPLEGTATGTFDEATRQENEPPHGAQTVWYAYRPAVSERVAVALSSTEVTGRFTIYTGASLTSLHQLGASFDEDTSRIAFDAVAGETYWIVVAPNYEAISTRFTLQAGPAPRPAHDDFAAAERITVPSRHTGSLIDATRELGEPRHGGVRTGSSVWYRFRARRTGRLTIDVNSDTCAGATLYTGSDITALRPVTVRMTDAIRFRAHRGRTYRLVVFCSGQSGEFSLTVSDGGIAGKGVEASADAGQTVDGIRSRGLRATVRTERRVSLDIAVVVSRSTARRLGLADRVLGRTTGKLGTNAKRRATIRLTSAARRALDGESRLTAILRLTVRDKSAPDRVLNVPIRLPN